MNYSGSSGQHDDDQQIKFIRQEEVNHLHLFLRSLLVLQAILPDIWKIQIRFA